MKKDYKKLLYERATEEFNGMVIDILNSPDKRVKNNLHEIIIKEEFLTFLDKDILSDNQARAMYKVLESPLERLYKNFEEKDYRSSDNVMICILDTAKEAVKSIRGKEHGSR